VKWLTSVKKTRKKCLSSECAVSAALSSGLTPPTIKSHAADEKCAARRQSLRPPNAAADHQFVGAQL